MEKAILSGIKRVIVSQMMNSGYSTNDISEILLILDL